MSQGSILVGTEGEQIRSILNKFVDNKLTTQFKVVLDKITTDIITRINLVNGSSSKVESIDPLLIDYHGKIFAGFFRLLKSYYYDIVTGMIKDESAIPSEDDKKSVVDAMIEYYEKMIRFRDVIMWRAVTAEPEEQKIIDDLSDKKVSEEEKNRILADYTKQIGDLTVERDTAKENASAKNAELQKTIAALTNARNEATRIVSENKSKLDGFAAEKAELLKNAQTFRENLVKTAETTAEQLAAAKKEKEVAQANAADKQKQLEQARANATNTKTALDTGIKSIQATLAKARVEMEKETAQTKGEIAKKQQELEQAKQTANAEITRIKAELVDARAQCNAKNASKQEVDAQVAQLQAALAQAQADKKVCEDEKKQLQETIYNLENPPAPEVPPPPPPPPPNACDELRSTPEKLKAANDVLTNAQSLINLTKNICASLYTKIDPTKKIDGTSINGDNQDQSVVNAYLLNIRKTKKDQYCTEIKKYYDECATFVIPAEISATSSPEDCGVYKQFRNTTYKDIQKIYDAVVNLNEDLAGAVRVLVKVKGGYTKDRIEALKRDFGITETNDKNAKYKFERVLSYVTGTDQRDDKAEQNPYTTPAISVDKTHKHVVVRCTDTSIIRDTSFQDANGYITNAQVLFAEFTTKRQTQPNITLDTFLAEKNLSDIKRAAFLSYLDAKDFKNFNGAFPMEFTNQNVFTGYSGDEETKRYNFEQVKITLKQGADVAEGVDLTKLDPNLYTTFQQVKDGYHICLFGYGYSGSGKTYTLLGGGSQKGLLHYGLESLNFTKLEVYSVFELYADMSVINGTGPVDPYNKKVKGNIHLYSGVQPIIPKIDKSTIFKAPTSYNNNPTEIQLTNISNVTTNINNYRIDEKRIKPTPNNPESSRSHLFITFRLTFQNGNTGFITIVDMAGQENPLDIQKVFFNSSYNQSTYIQKINDVSGLDTPETILNNVFKGIINVNDVYKTYIKSNKTIAKTGYWKEVLQYSLDILKEGFFINETLNHLRNFFQSKSGTSVKYVVQGDPKQDIKTDKTTDKGTFIRLFNYNPNLFYIDNDEQKIIDPNKNCLMQPILRYLDQLKGSGGESDKPTKFIMMCAVRPDKCEDSINSLKFGMSVKSSGQEAPSSPPSKSPAMPNDKRQPRQGGPGKWPGLK